MKYINTAVLVIVTIFCVNSFAAIEKSRSFDPTIFLKVVAEVCALPELGEKRADLLKEMPVANSTGYGTEGCGTYEYVENQVTLMECGDWEANWMVLTVKTARGIYRAHGSYDDKDFTNFRCF